MKYICILLIAFTTNTPLFSQAFTVSGTIAEEEGTPVEFANVVLTSADNTKVTGAVTDRIGNL